MLNHTPEQNLGQHPIALTEDQRQRLDALLAEYPDIKPDGKGVSVMYIPTHEQPFSVLITLYSDGGWNRINEFVRCDDNAPAREYADAIIAHIAARQHTDTEQPSAADAEGQS